MNPTCVCLHEMSRHDGYTTGDLRSGECYESGCKCRMGITSANPTQARSRIDQSDALMADLLAVHELACRALLRTETELVDDLATTEVKTIGLMSRDQLEGLVMGLLHKVVVRDLTDAGVLA